MIKLFHIRIYLLSFLILFLSGILVPIGGHSRSDPISNIQCITRLDPSGFQKCSEEANVSLDPNRDFQKQISRSSRNKTIPSQNIEFWDVGDQRNFWVYDFTDLNYYTINATVLAIGDFCYVFMEESCITELGEIDASELSIIIRNEFDNKIYPRVTDLAGHPNGTLGDIDGDPRIVILLSDNEMSYYSQNNEQSSEYSNECEMIYIYSLLHNWPFYLFTTIAHEFHHLIWFNNEMDEAHFVLEGIADYTSYHSGYLDPYNNITNRAIQFLSHSEDSLLYFNVYNEEGQNRAIDYGNSYLFAFYIAEHYGVDILRNLVKEQRDGAIGIESCLQKAGFNITFNELYFNWITALTIDKLGFENNLYGFKNLDARMKNFDLITDFPALPKTLSLRFYGFHIQKFQVLPKNFAIQIKKAASQTIGTSVIIHNENGWEIYKKLHDKPENIITDYYPADSIDEAYIITSYMLNDTPTDSIDFGVGPLIEIEISIFEATPTSSSSSETRSTTNLTSGFTNIFTFMFFLGILVCSRHLKNRSCM